ncbi:ABC transporter ATP-binding protein [Paenibacillus hexagrammi]|uniref:ATP-binding cassette domain-containing protein n=1 Tax=Paenibacillus hexagrammi TaxID=2908839 RepID=A0ABY3SJ45_9BACL|nr:ABC transporter transmembrane domain-containing protein [Paenibacillus sp. YPD9-1]UJF33545.1 ATP-binding cassette domain-containing protein [Paenibacillus sp. YPD9-1]
MFTVLKKLDWFFRMHWKRYTLAVGLLIIVGIIDVIPPKLIGYAIDGIHLGTLTGSALFRLLAFWGVLIVIGYGMTYVWLYQLFGGAFVLERILRNRLMQHLLRMTPTFYERNRTGDLMARATNDLQAVSTTAGFGILTFVDSTLFMLTILCMMGFFISWKLTIAAILPLPVMAVAITIYGGRIHERFMKAQDAFGEMNDRVLETIAGVRVIRAFVQETASQDNFKEMTDDVYRKNIAVARIDALFEPTVKILVGISYLIGLCYGGYMVFHSELTLGELVSFNTFLGMLIWPMFAIGELMNIMQRGNASLDRVNETLGYKPDVKDAPEASAMLLPNEISFQQVTFRYPSSSIDNLVNISLRLQRGQTLGIVGRTGSGKTTLLKQLLREYPIGAGVLSISGTPIKQLRMDTLHGWMGYVPQEPILFSRTVRENIQFGRSDGTDEDLNKALELAAFRKDVEFLPEGLDTIVGEKGVALSGGQKQRVSIARALYVDPEILMLDDALSAVDAKTETEILRGIRSERAGKTTLITTHRLSAVQHADWIVVLDEGYIVEEGTHEQLLARGGWYKEQYDRQQLEAEIEA